MKITRLQITNFRGVAALDAKIPPAGVTAKGSNGLGKTSIIRALRAALAAQDIGADAIRIGADSAEILVDMDAVQARRLITKTKSGGSLTVSKDIGGGVRGIIPSPQTYLTNLIGAAPLDPIELFQAKKPDRRKKILEALPVTVTVEQLRQWAPDLASDFDVSGHGLEVVGRVRDAYYDARATANAAVKTARADADRAKTEADRLAGNWEGTVLPLDQAEAQHKMATDALAALKSRIDDASAAHERTAKGRSRVAELRAKAAKEIEGLTAIEPETMADAELVVAEIGREVVALEVKLQGARARKAQAELEVTMLKARVESFMGACGRSAGLKDQASDLEATIAETTVAPPGEAEIATAAGRVDTAAKNVEDAKKAAYAIDARKKADDLARAVIDADAKAAKLDDVVHALSNRAPAELLAGSDGIKGLTLQGDDVLLDGVSLDGLCGAEQLKFAIEIARRANARSKILVVDGLERIDPDLVADFVKHATADGYQLICSRVDRGEIVLEAIEAEPPNGATLHAVQ